MEIRKNNIEIRKNWNKFTFKKLGIVFCLFLFGIVTFISGNLSQVNAASSSTVLPVAKGGTGSNSASGARTNLNAQEKLVSGTNIKSVFGQSLLGSGNITTLTTENKIAVGQSGLVKGGGGKTVTLADISCVFDTGICSWNLPSYCETVLNYGWTNEKPLNYYYYVNATSTTQQLSKQLLAPGWSGGMVVGYFNFNTEKYIVHIYKGQGQGMFIYATRIV
ncbi:MAG: hypothetical protein LBT99_00915 [Bifidobacteriaceae bacterium]|jgi:hypothetical protein|nr:hypothetical protein [Bifidobacteriaceae bacterium]